MIKWQLWWNGWASYSG